jgi:tetratricopeptide (TPR) repeat protein
MMLEPSKTGALPSTATQTEVYAQIVKDLNEAAAVLPTTYPSAELGRATKGAAYALLAKVYMQQKMWTEALTPLQWLVEGDGRNVYILMPNYRDNFLVTTENNRESIFEWQFETNTTETHDDDLQDPNQNYGTSLAQFIAPKPVGFQDVEGRRWMINEFHLERTTTGARDPRLEASFLYDSTDVRGPAFTQLYGQVWNNVGGLNKQGVYFRKFLNDHWKNDEGFRSKNNWRYLRYADVLLMYAEVLNEVGRTADAFQYVDRVRTRAGLANLPRTFNKDQFRDRLKHERVTELSGEGWRWHDLVRWGELTTDAPANVVARDPSFANYKANRDLFLPIPQRDIDINPNLKQNPNF